MNAYRTCPKIIGLINTDSKISKMFIVSYEDEEYSDENWNVEEANEEFAQEVLDADTKQEVIDSSSSRFFLHRKV